MNSYKAEVALADVVPNDGNPRRDFGDVAALAASIRATGGQPVSPIVVVPDGGRWRLVDGERRWRAMRELGTTRCDALVFADMGEAETAVAMMATDDNKALDEQERLRGFQSMLALGVDDDIAADVLGTDKATVRRVRRIAAEAPDQATLDGLIAAAEEEFTADERATIIAEGARRFGNPQAQADRIRRDHQRRRHLDAVRMAMPDGVEFRPGAKPYAPERDGLSFVRAVRDLKAAARLAAPMEGEADVVAYEDGNGYAVYRQLSEDALDPREAEAARVRRVRDEHAQAYAEAFREMCRYATEPWVVDDMASRHRTPASRRPNLCEVVRDRRTLGGPCHRVFSEWGHELLGPAATVAEDEDPSLTEVCEWLVWRHNSGGILGWSGAEPDERCSHDFMAVYDALLLDGWHPSDGAQAIRAMCPETSQEE